MTEKEFSMALRRGLGRAVVELKNSENRAVHNGTILRCCLRDISYDWQVEGTRGCYLYSVICATGERGIFEQAIAERFLRRCSDSFFCQLADILSCYAKDGSALAKKAFQEKYGYFLAKKGRLIKARIDEGFQWEYLARLLFVIDGFSAFERYATDVGDLLKNKPNDTLYYDWFVIDAEEVFGKTRVRKFMEAMYKVSDAIKALTEAIEAGESARKQYHENRRDELVSVETLLETAREMASGKVNHYGPIMGLAHPFLKNATDSDIMKLANAILSEVDETAKGLLLRVFSVKALWSKPFPLGADPLLEYAKSSNEVLFENAVGLLEEFKDKRIHDLAVDLLLSRGIESLALGLLIKNYMSSDDVVIAKAIKKAANIPQYVQNDIVDIYCRHRSENALPTLLHVYQRGECTHCRYHILKAMYHCKVLPDKILEECVYDSFKDTRVYAKRLIKKKKQQETVNKGMFHFGTNWFCG